MVTLAQVPSELELRYVTMKVLLGHHYVPTNGIHYVTHSSIVDLLWVQILTNPTQFGSLLGVKTKMLRDKTLKLRTTESEKLAFAEAADIAGLPLSAWIRERLRRTAIRELEGAGRRVPFINDLTNGDPNG
jgi:hypothetical protein